MDLVYSPSVCLLLAAAVFILLYALRDRMRRPAKNFPSGPPSLPVIGHLHMINLKRPSDALMKMSRTHGNIFRIQMGTVEMVVLAGYEAVKEALIDNAEVFSERPFVPVFEDMHQGYGIPFSHGDNWKEMRRFTLSTFRDFGMGKRTIEDKIIEECGFLIKEIEVYKDEPVELKEFISVAVGNIISSIVLGHRFDNYQHPTLLRVLELVHENFRLLGSPSVILYNIFPIMRFFPGDHKKIMKNLEELHCFLRETFLKHLKVLERDDQRGYIDAYLVRQLEEKGNPKSYFHEQNLLSILATLFAAGTDTTIASIRWAISFMVKNPLIQKRVHEEIDRVIGSSQPQFHHRTSMPYTNAVVHETQRVANVVPMNLPHATTTDVNFRGYHLPKGTYVVPLLESVLFDKTQFERAEEFYPEHFLDSDGKFVMRPAFLPFSTGKRICIGETLAKMEVFIFFTTLMQKFSFHAPPGEPDIEIKRGIGLTSPPLPQKLCIVRRS
uniref:Cytochrome P450 2K1 n=1 Tax=Xenopus tropicalis TaxID=8364 RepID=A0A803K1R9_XENTR